MWQSCSARTFADPLNKRLPSFSSSWGFWLASLCKLLPRPSVRKKGEAKQGVTEKEQHLERGNRRENERPRGLTNMNTGMKYALAACKNHCFAGKAAEISNMFQQRKDCCRLWGTWIFILILLLQLANCVSLGKWLSLSASQFPYLRPNSPTK